MLRRLLLALEDQRTDERFTYSVVVTDNDPNASARSVVEEFGRQSAHSVRYSVEPRKNIALARNDALGHATGDFVALIDDDEFPEKEWLVRLLTTCETYRAAGVLGPVRPSFERPPPAWLIRGRFCERAEYATGHVMQWERCRTGSVLFRRTILEGEKEPFLEQFGTGGEDVDFFRRMMAKGLVFRWCNEAVVYEAVPPERWTRAYMLRRAFLRGKNALKIPGRRARLIGKSLLALPVYSVVLPLTLLFGQHVFMWLCIRWCDHAGRVLGAVGLNPVRER